MSRTRYYEEVVPEENPQRGGGRGVRGRTISVAPITLEVVDCGVRGRRVNRVPEKPTPRRPRGSG